MECSRPPVLREREILPVNKSHKRKQRKLFASKLIFYTLRNVLWKRSWQNLKEFRKKFWRSNDNLRNITKPISCGNLVYEHPKRDISQNNIRMYFFTFNNFIGHIVSMRKKSIAQETIKEQLPLQDALVINFLGMMLDYFQEVILSSIESRI